MNVTTGNEQELRPGEEEALRALLRKMEPGAVAPVEVEQGIRRAVASISCVAFKMLKADSFWRMRLGHVNTPNQLTE